MNDGNYGSQQTQSGVSSTAPFVATFETGRHYRVHKSYIYLGPVVAVAAFVVIAVLNSMQGLIQLFMAAQDGNLPIGVPLLVVFVLLGILVVLGLMVGLYALAWRNMSYVFDEREFSYYSGIITKRRVHVPYARVQSVNHRASIVQRIAGVCSVTIDSAGGSSNKGVRVPYLRLETAERLRAELFMRKAAVEAGIEAALPYAAHADSASPEGAQAEADRAYRQRGQAPVAPGAAAATSPAPAAFPVQATSPWQCSRCGTANQPSAKYCVECGQLAPSQPNVLDQVAGPVANWRGLYGGASFGEQPASFEYSLNNRELLFTAASHDAPFRVAFIIAISIIVTFAFVLLVQDEVALFLAAIALPLALGFAVFGWIIGLVSLAISYGNFRARRRGARIEVERGLLAREFSGIDIDRVQTIEIRQSFIRRLMGYCEVSLGRIDAASDQNSGNNSAKANARGLVVHPFVKIDQVDAIIDGLAPELVDRPRHSDRMPLPAVALRRAVLRRCIWFNWALWIAVGVGVCWSVLGALANAHLIRFASAASHAQYDSFMVGSFAIVIAVCVIVTAIRGVGAVMWARHSGFTWNRKYLLLHNDGLSTSESIVPRQKIQAAATRNNPFQRRLALTTLQAVTAAGTHNTVLRLVDVPAEVGESYLDWAKPHRSNAPCGSGE